MKGNNNTDMNIENIRSYENKVIKKISVYKNISHTSYMALGL